MYVYQNVTLLGSALLCQVSVKNVSRLRVLRSLLCKFLCQALETSVAHTRVYKTQYQSYTAWTLCTTHRITSYPPPPIPLHCYVIAKWRRKITSIHHEKNWQSVTKENKAHTCIEAVENTQTCKWTPYALRTCSAVVKYCFPHLSFLNSSSKPG